ncbi:MAG: glutathione S-transferase N-terminal domain-containing protein [Marinifilaceae bacterium]|jgi:glutathione S-transferase|nr:glutathione S-transferase N-terminal domain-containing protein [Marinifilaceae bacterium]
MATNKIILHHNPDSSFSEQIRSLLSYLDIEWNSLETSYSIKRRKTQALMVQGYGARTPILQIGSDFYCDTRLISKKILEIANREDMLTPEIDDFNNNIGINSDYFFASINSIPSFNYFIKHCKTKSIRKAISIFKDETNFIGNHSEVLNSFSKNESLLILEKYYESFTNRLEKHEYLFGDNIPSLADFSAFQLIWLRERFGKLRLKNKRLRSWYKTMKSTNKHNYNKISDKKALKAAESSSPADIEDINLGNEIKSLIPNELLGGIMKPTKGLVVAEDEDKYIINTINKELGSILIHFPKICYGSGL